MQPLFAEQSYLALVQIQTMASFPPRFLIWGGNGWLAGLLENLLKKQGKEVFYSPTPAGEAFVEQYRTVREECLVKSLDTELNADIGELARLLRTMSGMYDQAARAATSL